MYISYDCTMRRILITLLLISGILTSCRQLIKETRTRQPVDTIGFAHYAWQMDSIMVRIDRMDKMQDSVPIKSDKNRIFRLAICPHDDYTYAGFLYTHVLHSVKAPVVILFGVAHKARIMWYATSIDHLRLPVEDLGMGKTANATLRHWVGYAAVGFE